MKICPNCGTKNSDSAKHCNFCDAVLPNAEVKEKKSAEYVHDEKTAKKKDKNRKVIIAVVAVLVVSIVAGLFVLISSGQKDNKAEAFAGVFSETFKNASEISGTLKGNGKNVSFKATIKESQIIVTISGGKYDFAFLSQDGMILKTERPDEKAEVKVTKDMDEYAFYVTYLMMTACENDPFSLSTDSVKKQIMPIVKEYLTEDFENVFIENNFASAIASMMKMAKNETDLKTYMGITLPDDINNGTVAYELSSYDLQNQVLRQLESSYKKKDDYDIINKKLKNAKSAVKEGYKSSGLITIQNGKISSAKSEMVYDGASYDLTVYFS